mmetsp:Transcript_10012/g.22776  ORF Transcript_10012/g.22776 Transcript_10012/m.22776 type:complete len:244 (-) Transcript_10012:1526-2257(-)
MRSLLIKDPKGRPTISQLRDDDWVTASGEEPLPTQLEHLTAEIDEEVFNGADALSEATSLIANLRRLQKPPAQQKTSFLAKLSGHGSHSGHHSSQKSSLKNIFSGRTSQKNLCGSCKSLGSSKTLGSSKSLTSKASSRSLIAPNCTPVVSASPTAHLSTCPPTQSCPATSASSAPSSVTMESESTPGSAGASGLQVVAGGAGEIVLKAGAGVVVRAEGGGTDDTAGDDTAGDGQAGAAVVQKL